MITKKNNLKKILNEHKNWIVSWGENGKLADFNGSNLDNANLEMADLSIAKFHDTSLRNSNLKDIYLGNAELYGADFEGANITRGNLNHSQCERANFVNTNLEGANLEGANLRETNFTKSILRGVNFKDANLSFSKMINARIEGANFEGANIEGANFEGTSLDKANFDEIQLKNLNVENTNLPKTDPGESNASDSTQHAKKSPEIDLNSHNFEKTALNQRPSIKPSKEGLFVDLNAVNPSMIEKAISELIKKLKSNIQFDHIKAICAHKHFIESIDNIDFKNGDIVTNGDQVAFKLDFNITYNLSLLLDRDGKLINVYRSMTKQIEK